MRLPEPVRRYQLAGARGGQGTTTVATVLAALAAGHGVATLAAGRPDDVRALAGTAAAVGDLTPLAPNLALVERGADATVTDVQVAVEDLGRLSDVAGHQEPEKAPGTQRWLVVRGPCYLSLRTALEAGWRADGVVLLVEPGRPLTPADVVDVLGLDIVAEIPVEAAVARSIDAGLLLAHLHRLSAFRALACLVQTDLGPARFSASARAPRTPSNLSPSGQPMHDVHRETSSTDYAASSKLPPTGRRERRRPAAAASAWRLIRCPRQTPSRPGA